MAYGVKYRLEFSDVLERGKKVEILKKDYTGEVLPMVGTQSPVVIQWQASDDFYRPIIGSRCALNLMVTDTVQYDDFYKFDEREYKVVVSYLKSNSEVYADRVIADGGTVESLNCVNTLASGISTEYSAYWSGFLVVDRFIEKLQPKPFNVSFNAFDGLGTLDNFEAPLSTNYTPSSPVYLSDAERISTILAHLDLDLEICFINDLSAVKIAGNPTNSYFPNTVSISPGFNELVNGYEIPNAKNQLEDLLKTYNMRIYQSNNKWYIVEATNIFDVDVKDSIYNQLQNTGVVPTNIRQQITNVLNIKNNEDLKVYNYNSSGVFQSVTKESFLSKVPLNLTPLKKNLTKEFIQPLASVKTESIDANFTQAGFNAGFEYGLSGYTVFNNYAEIATNEVVAQGNKSMKLSSSAPLTSQSNCFSPDNIVISDFEKIVNYKLNCKYFIKCNIQDNATAPPANIQFRIRVELQGSPGNYHEWNFDDKIWVYQTLQNNSITHTEFNQFETLKIDFTNDGITWVNPSATILSVIIQNTTTQNTFYETTYFDNLEVLNTELEAASSLSLVSVINDGNFNTYKKEFKRYNTVFTNRIDAFVRSRDNYGTFQTPNKFKTLYDLENQNIANDYREFVLRYEGSFRNLEIKPLAFSNKIWFNWSATDYDLQTSIIDRMTYNVKNAEYKIKAHIPNDDDDVTIINTIS